MWDGIKLKLEEASFFATQLEAHSRQPRSFLFYLCAFLSSARSVTFHIQKHLDDSGKERYRTLREAMLNDDVAKYFVHLRNVVEKEGYPTVDVTQLYVHRHQTTGVLTWTAMAGSGEVGPGRFEFLDQLLRDDLEVIRSGTPPARIEYRWTFSDFPGGRKDVGHACRDFANHLWEFVIRLRSAQPE